MKTKNNPHFTINVKLFLILPLILIVLVAFSSCASKKKVTIVQTEIAPPLPPPPPPHPSSKDSRQKEEVTVVEQKSADFDEDTPFVVVEEMPIFPGGDTALLTYIANNTKYPELAKTNNVQGRVIARFCVTKEGGVDRVSILRGVSRELDNEALRVVQSLPAFKPGRQGGKPVAVWYMVPITFALANKSEISNPEMVSPPPPPPPTVDEIFTNVDKLPAFKDGDSGLLKFIAENTTYPDQAKKDKITGKVFVKFVVEKDCSISHVEILEGVDPLLDAEAVKVVSSLPKFETPAIKEGIPVRVNYIIPITFTLK
jgi:TonB family protein